MCKFIFCSDGSLARFLKIREKDLSAGGYAQLAFEEGYGVSATSLRDATRTTKLSTSQSNAAHPTRWDNLFLGNP